MRFPLCLVVVCLGGVGAARAASPAPLAIPDFESLRARASDSVVISLDPSMLAMAGQYLSPDKPDDRAVKSAISGLNGIQVRSFSFHKPYELPVAELARLRAQLATAPWTRILQTHSESGHSDVEIWLASDGKRARGMLLIATGPLEFTVVSLDGDIDLARLHQLEGHLGVPALGHDR